MNKSCKLNKNFNNIQYHHLSILLFLLITNLVVRDFVFTGVDLLSDFLWGATINSASNTSGGSQDFLDSATQVSGHRFVAHLSGNIQNGVEGEITVVHNTLFGLWGFLKGLDDKGGGRGDDSNLGGEGGNTTNNTTSHTDVDNSNSVFIEFWTH